MTDITSRSARTSPRDIRRMDSAPKFLLLAFFLSGMSGLICQTVWVRMITRFLGSTTHATAAVMGVFLGGLALGAYLAGHWADRLRRPVRAYAVLEILIPIVGLSASYLLTGWLGQVYVETHHQVSHSPGFKLLAQVLFCAACLLPPTTLMGATLPILVGFVRRTALSYQAGLAKLYAINTYGAVAGVFLAGFVLLGELGETNSLYFAAGLNGLAALFAMSLEGSAFAATGPTTTSPGNTVGWQPYSSAFRSLALGAIFVSGFSSLAYEILWSRFLVLILQTSIYSFSLMLGLLLLGISWGAWDASRSENHRKGTGRRLHARRHRDSSAGMLSPGVQGDFAPQYGTGDRHDGDHPVVPRHDRTTADPGYQRGQEHGPIAGPPRGGLGVCWNRRGARFHRAYFLQIFAYKMR